jgi:hypothetical protein
MLKQQKLCNEENFHFCLSVDVHINYKPRYIRVHMAYPIPTQPQNEVCVSTVKEHVLQAMLLASLPISLTDLIR